MAKTAPTEEELRVDYVAGVGAKGQKWFRKTMAASGVIEAGRSEAAESAYAAKMQAVISNRQRQKGLAQVTDSDVKAGVQAVGAGGYSTRASAKAGKFAKRAKSYVDLAVSVANALPARTADPVSNVNARVIPIVTALHNKKTGGT